MTAGIYAITNTVNGHQYVGQSEDIEQRWALHRSQLGKGKHHSRYLQRAWNAHGPDCFTFVILEVIAEPTQELLNQWERHYFALLKPTYASRPAGSQRGYRHRPESRAKMSLAKVGIVPLVATLAAAEANRNKTRPQSVRDKISATKRAQGTKRPDLAERNRQRAKRPPA